MSTEASVPNPPATGSADVGQPATEGANTRSTGPSRSRRERRNANNNRNTRPTESAPSETKFTGRCDELKGEIYDCSEYSKVDGYTKTTKEIAEYVGRIYSADARTSVKTLSLPTFDYPSDPAENATDTDKRKWQKRVDSMVVKEDRFEEDLKKVYSLVWGQCTEYLRAKIEAKDSYEEMKAAYNTIELLKSIKDRVFKFSDQKYAAHSLHEAMRKFYAGHQDKTNNAQVYYQRFKNHVEVDEHCSGSVGNHDGLVDKQLEEDDLTRANASTEELRAAKAAAKEEYLACAFLLGSDRKRYRKLIENLENDHVQRNDKYPKTLVEAYNLLIHWKQDPKNLMQVLGSTSDGVAFTNIGDKQRPTQGRTDQGHQHPGIQCFHCQEMGHYASSCNNEWRARGTEASGTQALMDGTEAEDYDDDYIGFDFLNVEQVHNASNGRLHNQGAEVSKTWILLDNQSTVDVFCNPKLLKNIRQVNKVMNIKCNAGVTRTNMVGDLSGYGEVWYNKDGIANILSFSRVEKKYRVTYDSTVSKQFIVHKKDGGVRRFKQSKNGLFYLDAMEAQDETDNTETKVDCEGGTVLFNTVDENKIKYTNAAYKQATLARKLQNIIGRPSARAFLNIVENNLLKDCPVLRADVLAAEDIFGPNVGSLRGKTVRSSGDRVRPEYEEVPKEIKENYQDITICMDLMYVNRIPFLVTISRNIKFGTIKAVKSRHIKVLLPAIKSVKRLYALRGFRVKYSHADNEFEPMRDTLLDIGIQLNVVAEAEHVPEVERYIRTIKERTRCVYNTVPFKRMPSRMVIEMVHASVFWLNMFPAADGVSNILSPRALIVGLKLDYNKHCKLEFGSYVQVHEEHDNSMASRTTGAIALRPTGNAQGGYYFMSLTSGRRLSRNHWTSLPVPQDVIDRVHALARRSNASRDLTFAWRDGTTIADEEDDDKDSDYEPDDDDTDYNSDNDSDDDAAPVEEETDEDSDNEQVVDDVDLPLAGVDDEMNNERKHEQDDPEEITEENNEEAGQEETAENEDLDEEPIEESDVNENETAALNESTGVDEQSAAHDEQAPIIPGVPRQKEEAAEESLEEDMNNRYGRRTERHDLRPRRKPTKKYSKPIRPNDHSKRHATLEHYAMTQYSVKKGIRVFGEAGKPRFNQKCSNCMT
jgi:hypothetical protein